MVSEGILLGLGVALCWGVADFFAKIATTREKNYVPIHISAFFGFLILIAYNILSPPVGYAPFTIIFGIAPVAFLWAFGWWLFFLSLREGKVSVISSIGGSFGLVTLLLGMVVLGETPSILQILGALLIVISVFILSLGSLDLSKIIFDQDSLRATGAMICWGIGFIMIVPFAKAYPPQVSVLSHVMFTLIFTTLFVLISGKKFLPSRKRNFIPSIFASVDAIGNVIYYAAAATVYTSLLAPLSSIYPLFAVILAYLFLNERLKRFQIVSIAGILLGILLISM
ncbi:MAG: DMT family transporter [Candidatus Micrarchaeota archaeon]